MSDFVRVTEVSPRDGLQNEHAIIPADRKVQLIERLARTGVDEIEVTSFVSPRWVPQLADAEEVLTELFDIQRTRPILSALVPNVRGLERLLAINERAGFPLISKVSVFTAASETFSQRNTNATIAQTIERFDPVVETARANNLKTRAYISCAIACPFEGPIKPPRVRAVADQLINLGVDEIDLGDTIGVAHPADIADLLALFQQELHRLTLHLHDTFARAADCVRTALELGVRSFDASAAGLGGCPYASTPGKRAPGNISTELLVRTIHSAGHKTTVDLGALAQASAYAAQIVADSRGNGAAS